MRVVVAPTAFKGTATPRQAADAVAEGWRRARPDDELVLVPMADGGDGTAEVLAASLGGRHLRRIVAGPLGEPVAASAILLESGDAVVEVASASGLVLVAPAERDVMAADTRGTGELVAACLGAGARRVLVGVGGSATTDGGAGMAAALGVRFLGDGHRDVGTTPAALERLEAVDVSGRLAGAEQVVGLVDVRNPLLGPSGAAAVYGPQKGARPPDVERLEAVLRRLAEVTGGLEVAERPGAGAAGGLGFGIVALLGGSIVPGGDMVADMVGLDLALTGADLVLTGEGRLDSQTAFGKAPAVVARIARDMDVRCAAVVGTTTVDEDEQRALGFSAVVPCDGDGLDVAAARLAQAIAS